MWFVFLNLMNITTATLSMCAKRGWTDPSVQCRGVVLIPLPIQYILLLRWEEYRAFCGETACAWPGPVTKRGAFEEFAQVVQR